MNDEKLRKAIIMCYRKMFKAAEPSADFDELIRTGETKKPDFFMKYYLSTAKTEAIINEVAKKMKLNRIELNSLKTNIYLGSSPTSSKERWQEERNK